MVDPESWVHRVNYMLGIINYMEDPASESAGYNTGMGLWGLIVNLGHRIHPRSWELSGTWI